MIRPATTDDIPLLVEMGGEFHAMTPYTAVSPYDPQSIANVLAFMIADPRCAVLTHGHGVIGGTLAPLFMHGATIMLEENFWWARSDGMGLLKALEDWGREQGATRLSLSILENERTDTMQKMIARKGYQTVERRAIKEI